MMSIALASLLASQGCTANFADPAGSRQAIGAQFGCCLAADIDTIRHPGETFQIHWIRTEVPVPAGQRDSAVTLNVSLSGTFGSVSDVKKSVSGDGRTIAEADTVTTTSSAADVPVSTLTIPLSARPGFYSLTSVVSADGGVLTGKAVVQVANGGGDAAVVSDAVETTTRTF